MAYALQPSGPFAVALRPKFVQISLTGRGFHALRGVHSNGQRIGGRKGQDGHYTQCASKSL